MENNIVFVAVSDSMKKKAEEVIRKMGFSIPVIMSRPDIVLQDINRYLNIDIFISRWNTAQILRSAEKNVIDIRVEFQDLIEPLQKLSGSGVKKVAVLTQKGVIADCEKRYQVSDTTIIIRNYNSLKEVDGIVRCLISEEVEGLIGGQAVIDSAQKYGLPSGFLNCGEDSIRHAVEEAIDQIKKISSERKHQSESINHIQKFSSELYTTIAQSFGAVKKLEESSQKLAVISKDAVGISVNAYEQMKETENILNLISKISMETKILGINGAIEAARTGDQGQGFAIIAEEIRQLAITSNQSAKDISADIDKLKKYMEEVLKNAEISKSIAVSQAADNGVLTSMLEELSENGKKLIDYMNQNNE